MRTPLVLVAAASLALAALSTAPVAAETDKPTPAPAPHVATPLGQVGTPAPCGVTGPGAAVIDTLAPGTPTYTAPFNGVVTRFSHQANGVNGRVQAIVFADGSATNQKSVVAASPKQAVSINTLNSFAVRVPMKKGQKLGLGFTVNGMACATSNGFAGDSTLVAASFDPDTTTSFSGGTLSDGVHSLRPNITAILEPDIDDDGYGDGTQDSCPASALTQAVCLVPDTKITKRPKHKSTSKKVKIKVGFVSTVSGSTFQCRLDSHKKWKTCTSPFTRRLGPGRHRVQVRAVSSVGVVDPKPSKVKFTIVRVRHR